MSFKGDRRRRILPSKLSVEHAKEIGDILDFYENFTVLCVWFSIYQSLFFLAKLLSAKSRSTLQTCNLLP